MTAIFKLFRTTTFRLSLTFIILFGAAAAMAIGYIYWQTNVLLSRQLEQTVQAEIRGLAEQYRQGGLQQLANIVAERSLAPGNSLYLVANNKGQKIAGNLSAISRELWDITGRVEFVYRRPAEGGQEDRLGFANIFRLQGGYRLLVGRDIEDRREFESVIRSAFIWGLGLMALVGLFAGWLVSRNLLSRIDQVSATSRKIMSGNLAERIALNGSGDELDRLSQNLNLMLDKIEDLMSGLKEISDNIAHDLKTPLNRLRNRVEVALHEQQGEEEYRSTLQATIEEADSLIKTFNSLLSIARLEAGATSDRLDNIDLSSVVKDVIELYEPVFEEQNVHLAHVIEDGVILQADRQLIAQALANLVENALKYGVPASVNDTAGELAGEQTGEQKSVKAHIQLGLQKDEKLGQIQIYVADHGPGIPEEEREHVLKRFVRLEQSRSQPGSGLGLSLVAAVARLFGGRIELHDYNPGLKAIMIFPLYKNENASALKESETQVL